MMVRYGGGTSSEIYFVSKNGKNITQDIKDRVNEAISYPQKIDGGIYILVTFFIVDDLFEIDF